MKFEGAASLEANIDEWYPDFCKKKKKKKIGHSDMFCVVIWGVGLYALMIFDVVCISESQNK